MSTDRSHVSSDEESPSYGTHTEEDSESDAERIRLLHLNAAIASVSQSRPKASTMRAPSGILKFDRDELCEHLSGLVENANQWSAFKETKLMCELANDGEHSKPVIANVDEGAGLSLWERQAASPSSARSPTPTNNSHEDSSSNIVALSGHQGPYSSLMGMYHPCKSTIGEVVHNGQPLYRLHRPNVDIQMTVQGCVARGAQRWFSHFLFQSPGLIASACVPCRPELFLAYHKVRLFKSNSDEGFRWCVLHEYQVFQRS